MAVPVAALAKIAAVALSDEDTRRKLGWIVAAICSPLILTLAMICSLLSGSGGANNIQQLARQAQKLQDDMEAASKELETKEYEATAGGGAVKVTVTGKMELTKVEISPEVVDPEDVEMLSDLVMAAANEAIRAAAKEKEDKMETISGGLNIPGMF